MKAPQSNILCRDSVPKKSPWLYQFRSFLTNTLEHWWETRELFRCFKSMKVGSWWNSSMNSAGSVDHAILFDHVERRYPKCHARAIRDPLTDFMQPQTTIKEMHILGTFVDADGDFFLLQLSFWQIQIYIKWKSSHLGPRIQNHIYVVASFRDFEVSNAP